LTPHAVAAEDDGCDDIFPAHVLIGETVAVMDRALPSFGVAQITSKNPGGALPKSG